MRKTIYIIALLLFSAFGLNAQEISDKVLIDSLRVNEIDTIVNVSFTVHVDKKAVRRNHTLVFAPVLTNGIYKVSMHPVVIEGKGTAANRKRHEWVAGATAGYENAVMTTNGQIVHYRAEVPAQSWMHGARLVLESVLGGCCSYEQLREMPLIAGLHLREEIVIEQPVLKEPLAFEPVSVGDTLSMAFSFVLPESMFDSADPFRIYDNERDDALIVYYHVAKHDIDPSLMDNERTLINLTAAINMILDSKDSNMKRVVVAGFASPEGSFLFNDRLAFERAVSVKEHIMKTTGIKDEAVLIHNGSEDWRGLRMLVMKSDLREEEKRQVINIIDTVPVWNSQKNQGRLSALQKLNGGYTYTYLLKELFPLLRNGAFIKVYYENK